MAVTPDEHRAQGAAYFNAAWDLIETPNRTPEQDRDLLTLAFASRQHWIEAEGSAENLAVADWQIAHAASQLGLADLALTFARAAVARAEANDVPTWMKASAHEGLARAHATAGQTESFTYEADLARALLEKVADPEDRALIETQLASIPAPD
jgi:putative alpha-1,2-mannosidase